jgi:Helix-turn-helix domain
MEKNMKINAKTRLLSYLSKDAGSTLTVAQARSRFKIANPTARIADLRKEGHNIVTTMRTGRDGIERAVYSLAPTATKRSTARRTVKA